MTDSNPLKFPRACLKQERRGFAALRGRRLYWLAAIGTACFQLCLPGAAQPPAAQKVPSTEHETISYREWSLACKNLPSNRSLKGTMPPRDRLPIQEFSTFASALLEFMSRHRESEIAEPSAWLNGPPDLDVFLDPNQSYLADPQVPFYPFVQRVRLPSGSRVLLHGDFHGDIRSLIALLDRLNRTNILDGFRIVPENVYFCFLGDYTDRGSYGVEVIYTLLQLKRANPDRVFMARGNHEDAALTAQYGYFAEAQAKYGRSFNALLTARIYDFLPLAIYLGCGDHYAQCCHGGMEPGFDPAPLLNAPEGKRFQWVTRLNQRAFLTEHPAIADGAAPAFQAFLKSNLIDFKPLNPLTPRTIGFMWNDFTVFQEEPALDYNPGRGFVYGQPAARYLMKHAGREKAKLRAVLRAHQHSSVPNPLMRRLVASDGVFRHWQSNDAKDYENASTGALKPLLRSSKSRRIPDGSVWTFNVSPDSAYGVGCGFAEDSFGWLTVSERPEDWRLEVVSHSIPFD